jgi:hypothetical protein
MLEQSECLSVSSYRLSGGSVVVRLMGPLDAAAPDGDIELAGVRCTLERHFCSVEQPDVPNGRWSGSVTSRARGGLRMRADTVRRRGMVRPIGPIL